MKKPGNALIEFDGEARKLFFALYKEFFETIQQINRKKDDNVFYLVKGKYLYTLQAQLKELAKRILDKHGANKDSEALTRKLTSSINEYTNEFQWKSQML